MMHPGWYYYYYDEIFGWSRDYPKEIAMINDIASLKNKVVEEIGAGTGRHTEQILKLNPRIVRAIDYDDQAVGILKEKFKQDSKIQIIKGDGFIRDTSVDIIICLYSIFQQTEEKTILKKRIDNLIGRLDAYGCDIFVECIDTNKHKTQEFTLIYESGQDYLGIKSEKTDYGVKIVYQGIVNNENVVYEVPLCDCPLYLFEINSSIKYEIIPLTKSGRKRIIHIFK